VILAGGLATRMRPLTDGIPKAMLPVAGRPFADHQLEYLAKTGVTDVVMSIGYRGDMLRDHVGDGARFGLRVVWVDEGKDLRGTAGALRLALDHGVLDQSFLVLWGDSYLTVDFADVWARFRASGKPALMTIYKNQGRYDTSNVIVEGDHILYDKRHATRPREAFDHIDYGLMALERRLIETEVPATGKADLADLFHALSLRGELAGYEVPERFHEIGSLEGLRALEQWLTARR
jgi:NDP-sugar pyrophosphorylase family protein